MNGQRASHQGSHIHEQDPIQGAEPPAVLSCHVDGKVHGDDKAVRTITGSFIRETLMEIPQISRGPIAGQVFARQRSPREDTPHQSLLHSTCYNVA